MSDQDDSAPVQAATDLTPWQALRAAREAQGLSQMDVAQHLKLTPRQIEAMEAGDIAALPGPAFARGFVRNYARLLHLDPAPYSALIDAPREDEHLDAMPVGKLPGRQDWKSSPLPALAAVLALFGLAVAGWHYRWFEPRDEQYIAEWMAQSAALAAGEASNAAPEILPVTPQILTQAEASSPTPEASGPTLLAAAQSMPGAASVPLAASAPVAASVSATTSAPAVRPQLAASPPSAPLAQSVPRSVPGKSGLLQFSFAAESWVEVRDAQGAVLVSRLFPSGENFELRAEGPLDLVVGNAAEVKLLRDGKAVGLMPPANSSVARLRLP